jgi:hypothetical protein
MKHYNPINMCKWQLVIKKDVITHHIIYVFRKLAT